MKKLLLVIATMMILTAAVTAQSVCDSYSLELIDGPTWTVDGYKWTYEACQYGQWDISHVVIGACVCSEYSSLDECQEAGKIVDWGVDGGVTYNGFSYEQLDPTTGVQGFKFDETDWSLVDGNCAIFWIITQTDSGEDRTSALKPNGYECNYTTTGPVCDETTTTTQATTTTTFAVPEPASGAIAALAIILASPGFAYLLVKRG